MKVTQKAFSIYADYWYRALILDIISDNKHLNEPKLLTYIFNEIEKDKEIGNVTMKFIGISYRKLIGAKLITSDETGIVTLTEFGESAVRNGKWHGLALSAWVGYKSLSIAQWALWIALGSFIVTIISLLLVGLK